MLTYKIQVIRVIKKAVLNFNNTVKQKMKGKLKLKLKVKVKKKNNMKNMKNKIIRVIKLMKIMKHLMILKIELRSQRMNYLIAIKSRNQYCKINRQLKQKIKKL